MLHIDQQLIGGGSTRRSDLFPHDRLAPLLTDTCSPPFTLLPSTASSPISLRPAQSTGHPSQPHTAEVQEMFILGHLWHTHHPLQIVLQQHTSLLYEVLVHVIDHQLDALGRRLGQRGEEVGLVDEAAADCGMHVVELDEAFQNGPLTERAALASVRQIDLTDQHRAMDERSHEMRWKIECTSSWPGME